MIHYHLLLYIDGKTSDYSEWATLSLDGDTLVDVQHGSENNGLNYSDAHRYTRTCRYTRARN